MLKKEITLFKIGGSAINSKSSMSDVLTSLKGKFKAGSTILVHGGGGVIDKWLKKLGVSPKFIDGQRVTDAVTISVVEMVLSGLVNKQIVSILTAGGFDAVGISGRDGNLAVAENINSKLGYVGEIVKINSELLLKLLKEKIIPVISPVCSGADETVLNVNADFFASSIAVSVQAAELNFITATGGVLKSKKIITNIATDDIPLLIKDKTVSKGMIPKLLASLDAKKGGVRRVNLLDYSGRIGTSII